MSLCVVLLTPPLYNRWLLAKKRILASLFMNGKRNWFSGHDLRLSDFVTIRELARSESGSVFLAQWQQNNPTGHRVVILKEKNSSELGRMTSVRHEVNILSSIPQHDNIIKCLGWFWKVTDRSIYIILEYADRGDLSTLYKKHQYNKQPIPESDIWEICSQLCNGLHHLHTRGILHRDIKLLNIFISSVPNSKRVCYKLGDFGISRQLSKDTLQSRTFNVGTPLYM